MVPIHAHVSTWTPTTLDEGVGYPDNAEYPTEGQTRRQFKCAVIRRTLEGADECDATKDGFVAVGHDADGTPTFTRMVLWCSKSHEEN